MIKGKQVTLYEKTVSGTDGFNQPIYTEVPVDVEDVIIAPADASAVIDDLKLYGKHLAYELHLPKGDSHNWDDAKVSFYGKTFKTYGPAQEWIDENVPGKWNRKVKVEFYG